MTTGIPDFEGRRLLADDVRRLLRAVRTTKVGDEQRDAARALVRQAAELLELDAPRRPLWHTGLDDFELFAPSTDPDVIFPFSPAMGALNPVSPVVDLRVDDDLVVHGEVTFTEYHNGPPFDLAHGGAIALVYDELLGVAAIVGAGGGMTANLTVDYRRPTPCLVPIQVTARMGEHHGRKFVAHGEMRHDGELLTEATGIFVRPRDRPIAEADAVPPAG